MIEEDGEMREYPTKNAEEIRVAHWWRSKRGPAFLAPLLFLLDQPVKRFETYIKREQVMVDLGCGWGHYAFMLADKVGPAGRVYAVDLAEKCIRNIQQKAAKRGYRNIVAKTSSASELSFIQDKSVDLVFANGLLCSMAVDRSSAVSEIIRIIKPGGMAYISLGAHPPMGYVDEFEWKEILGRFEVVSGGPYKKMWALVKKKVSAA